MRYESYASGTRDQILALLRQNAASRRNVRRREEAEAAITALEQGAASVVAGQTRYVVDAMGAGADLRYEPRAFGTRDQVIAALRLNLDGCGHGGPRLAEDSRAALAALERGETTVQVGHTLYTVVTPDVDRATLG
jgi:hypothetical protein